MACCDDEYHIVGDDPTLSACCAKDLKERKHYDKVMGILTKEDVTRKRLEQRYITIESHQVSEKQVALTCMDESEDDEFDYLMDDESFVNNLEQERRAALLKKITLREQGLGIVWGDKEFELYVRNVQSQDATIIQTAKHNRPVVIVKKHSSDEIHALLSEALVACAEKYLGTCFFIISNKEILSTFLRKNVSGPVIMALNDQGDYIAHKALDMFQNEDWDGMIMPWLQQCNVLQDTYVNRIVSNKIKKDEEEEEEEAISGYDCGHDGCRLKFGYYHEHVGASKETKQEIAQWRQ
ncbi:hypothetical protein THRCLA_02637 [Thraustotheca clavata]|uniref:Phosducin thioredoxin-like domain-containing protein n=1 Tax=Thraustotheca clavata TaxID=74557 RepID=A0A1W0A4N2_9STRA|nr:hypothetical protein THRCLA_02637 [Thraustotheca clavata]